MCRKIEIGGMSLSWMFSGTGGLYNQVKPIFWIARPALSIAQTNLFTSSTAGHQAVADFGVRNPSVNFPENLRECFNVGPVRFNLSRCGVATIGTLAHGKTKTQQNKLLEIIQRDGHRSGLWAQIGQSGKIYLQLLELVAQHRILNPVRRGESDFNANL